MSIKKTQEYVAGMEVPTPNKNTEPVASPEEQKNQMTLQIEKLQHDEERMRRTLRESLSESLRATDREVPRSALVGLALMRLFAIETVSAETVNSDETQMEDSSRLELTFLDKPSSLSPLSKEILQEYLTEGVIELDSVNYGNSERGEKNKEKSVTLDKGILDSPTAWAVMDSVDHVRMKRTVSTAEVKKMIKQVGEGTITAQEPFGSLPRSFIAESNFTDYYGNAVFVYWTWDEGDSSAKEHVFIDPSTLSRFQEDGDAYHEIKVDLAPLFLGNSTADVTLAWEPKLISKTAIQGIPVYIEKASLESVFITHEQEIQNGITTTFHTFGLEPQKAFQRIHVVDSQESNATAYWTHGTMEFTDALLEVAQTKKLTGYVEEVTEHESLHFIGEYFKIHSDPIWQTEFYSASSEILSQFNESFLSHIPENAGHAQDNPYEYFASMMNSLDDPELEIHLQALTPAALEHYHRSLTFAGFLLQQRSLSKEAPIFKMIDHAKSIIYRMSSEKEEEGI